MLTLHDIVRPDAAARVHGQYESLFHGKRYDKIAERAVSIPLSGGDPAPALDQGAAGLLLPGERGGVVGRQVPVPVPAEQGRQVPPMSRRDIRGLCSYSARVRILRSVR